MIKLTCLDDKEIVINAEHIEKLEQTQQSVITLTNGNKYLVKESNDEVIKKVIEYKRKIFIGDIT